jgi:hypothetical protein
MRHSFLLLQVVPNASTGLEKEQVKMKALILKNLEKSFAQELQLN